MARGLRLAISIAAGIAPGAFMATALINPVLPIALLVFGGFAALSIMLAIEIYKGMDR